MRDNCERLLDMLESISEILHHVNRENTMTVLHKMNCINMSFTSSTDY